MDFASYVHQYYKSGYLVYQEGGEAGKVCVDHMNKTVPKTEVGRVLNKLGESMCNTLEYRDLVSIEIMVDNEQEVNIILILRLIKIYMSDSIIPGCFIILHIFYN